MNEVTCPIVHRMCSLNCTMIKLCTMADTAFYICKEINAKEEQEELDNDTNVLYKQD